jgi:hypothetical protein
MRHLLLLLGSVALLAAFSPPDILPPQGVQEGPPKSWIPEKAPKAPIIVTPDLPEKPTPGSGGDTSTPGERLTFSVITPQPCAKRERTGGKVPEAFVNAYNEAKTRIVARDYEKGLSYAREAEDLAKSFEMRAAVLGLQILAGQGLRDAARIEQVIARRSALGCVRAWELKMFEQAREAVKPSAPQ